MRLGTDASRSAAPLRYKDYYLEVAMPRKSHDFFAKEWMKELLADFGEVKVERPVASEVRTIDLVFLPDPDRLEDLQDLGLLGRMLSQPCPVEFFRNAVPTEEIINCRDKNADLRAELVRVAAQKAQVLAKQDLPKLWITTPTLSKAKQKTFCMVTKPEWGQGIYFLPENDFTRIVVVHQLPVNLDTLWVRLLGRGQVQAQAVQELLALSEDYPYRQETLRHLAALQVNLQMRQNKSKDLREVAMNLAPVYEQWRAQTIEEGKQSGEEIRAVRIARRMLQKNTPLEEIAELTELPLEQIQALQAETRS